MTLLLIIINVKECLLFVCDELYRADFMEEELLKPYIDFEAVWEQEYKTLQRKLESKESSDGTTKKEKDDDDDDTSMCPCDPATLVSMATCDDEGQSVDELKTLVVAFTDEHNETMMMLPKRTCLFPN